MKSSKPRNIGKRILYLRSEGWSYDRIQYLLNCSRSTISYHCGKDQKSKTYARNKGYKARKRAEKQGTKIVTQSSILVETNNKQP